MKSLRSFFITLGGLTFVAVAALFTASLGLAVAGAVAVLVLGQWISSMINSTPAPVRAYARARRYSQQERLHIWNDGKGKIIDM